MKTFANEPLTDFTIPANKLAFKKALTKVKAEMGKSYPLVIGGQKVKSKRTFKSYNPSAPKQVIGTFPRAGETEAQAALDAAWEAFGTWSRQTARYRARFLFETARLMRRRKHEFSATMVLEAGKTWVEADADTAEAIDFLEFYGREAIRLAGPQEVGQIPSELSELFYIPLGVGAIIPPWNFPNAILIGMTSAAIVAGNTVVLKPASDSPYIAWKVFSLFEELNLPPGVVNFLPGPGSAAGEYLVNHADTRFISFTGSKAVGLGIVEKAGKQIPRQRWIKRVMVEMGGKDTMVIADDADLDAASTAVIAAAFSFQGQKCSACSRAIIDEKVYDEFVRMLVAKTKKIKVGDPANFANYMGPVINKASLEKVKKYIAIGKKQARLLVGGKTIPTKKGGYFVQPTIFTDVKPKSALDQEEIFGPVLALLKVKSFEQAIALANATEYGLTGSVYTQDRLRIEMAKREFHVGNLYINRKCTGALVDVQPFGGFNMSGTDSKAGGHDYLLQHMQAKSVSEKLDN